MNEAVTVVGAGAIGGFIAARLVESGHDVLVVEANQRHTHAMRQKGLRLVGATSVTVRPRVVLPDEVDEPLDTVLLAVKARDTGRAIETIAPMLSADGCIVSLQNGLEEYRIADAVGAARTVGAALTFGGHYVAPGVVHYGGPGSLHLGELDGSISDRLLKLRDVLSVAHPVEITERIFGLLWGKTALGAFYFGTALIDADVPDILSDDQTLRVLSRPVQETARVAIAAGVEPSPVDGFDPLAFLTNDTDGIAASWKAQRRYWAGLQTRRTGVWRDLNVHHRPTELREILGPVLDHAKLHGIEVPALRRLFASVEAAESGRRTPAPQR